MPEEGHSRWGYHRDDDHFCVVGCIRHFRKGILGWAAAFAVVLAANAFALARRLMSGTHSLPSAIAEGVLLLLVPVIVVTYRHQFRGDRPLEGWKERAGWLALLLGMVPICLGMSAAPWLPLPFLPLAGCIGCIAGLLLGWALYLEAEKQAGGSDEAPQDKTITGRLIIAFLFCVALLAFVVTFGKVATSHTQSVKSTLQLPGGHSASVPGDGNGVKGNNGSDRLPNTPPTPRPAPVPAPAGCTVAPGQGAPYPINTFMAEAASEAAPEWGCIEAIRTVDGAYVQGFEYSDSFLLGTPVGAGLAGDLYASAMGASTAGYPSVTQLGGQPVDIMNCAQDRSDFEPIIGEQRTIVRLFGRARKSRTGSDGETTYFTPYEISPSLLADWLGELETDGVILAPTGPAVITGRTVSQYFVNINSEVPSEIELQGEVGTPVPTALTPQALWSACEPGMRIQAQFALPPGAA